MSKRAAKEQSVDTESELRRLLVRMSGSDQNYFIDPTNELGLPYHIRLFALHCPIDEFGKMAHHPLLLVVNYATAGVVIVEDHGIRLEPGHALLVSPGRFHDYVAESGDDALWLFLNFEVEESHHLERLTLAPVRVPDACHSYLETLVGLYAEGAGKRMNRNFRARVSLLLALILEVLLQTAEEAPPEESEAVYKLGPVQPYRILQRASEYVREHLQSPLHIEDIANALDISAGHLRNVFHERLGMGPGEYVQYVRQQQACVLMDTTGMSLSEIALSCGYNSLSAFSRAFRKNRGMAPRDYRLRYSARSAKRKR